MRLGVVHLGSRNMEFEGCTAARCVSSLANADTISRAVAAASAGHRKGVKGTKAHRRGNRHPQMVGLTKQIVNAAIGRRSTNDLSANLVTFPTSGFAAPMRAHSVPSRQSGWNVQGALHVVNLLRTTGGLTFAVRRPDHCSVGDGCGGKCFAGAIDRASVSRESSYMPAGCERRASDG